MLGGMLSFAGVVLAQWLVREREIEPSRSSPSTKARPRPSRRQPPREATRTYTAKGRRAGPFAPRRQGVTLLIRVYQLVNATRVSPQAAEVGETRRAG